MLTLASCLIIGMLFLTPGQPVIFHTEGTPHPDLCRRAFFQSNDPYAITFFVRDYQAVIPIPPLIAGVVKLEYLWGSPVALVDLVLVNVDVSRIVPVYTPFATRRVNRPIAVSN